MPLSNTISKGDTCFITATVVDWVDVFTRPRYRHILTDSLLYCISAKGLILNAWTLMSNHLHFVGRADEGLRLSDILRDFKKFTSRKIVASVQEGPESRQDWMMYRFGYNAKFDSRIQDYQFWQEGNGAKIITSREFLLEKIRYTHYNAVTAEIVEEPHHYRYSSAIDYAGGKGLLPVELAFSGHYKCPSILRGIANAAQRENATQLKISFIFKALTTKSCVYHIKYLASSA